MPPEFALMAACCRWPPSASRSAAIAEAVRGRIDWARFERVVARHRVAPLVHDGLRRLAAELPSATARRLALEATAAGATALAMARETIRLQREFDRLDIPMLTVKGSSLAVLAYGDLGMKQARDIDLLTLPETIGEARGVLEGLGYQLGAHLDRIRFERLARFTKECTFTNPSLGITIDLHWQLTDNLRLLPGLGARSPYQEVGMGDARVRTLAKDPLFAFLCVHGTHHGWSRFKWLADVGAYIARDDPTEMERLYRAAIALGAGRGPAVALRLGERVLGLRLPAGLVSEIDNDRTSKMLAVSALRCMTWRGGEAEIGEAAGPQLRIALSHFLLMPGRRYWWREVGRKWGSPGHPAAQDWGPRFLYHLFRIPLLLMRFGRRWLSGA